MAFRNSTDAFEQAVRESAACKDLKISYSIGFLRNGIKHCSVQLTYCSGGYNIDAYDGEADELFDAAKKYSASLHLIACMPTI
jgi:hypothetical protein